MSKKGLSLEEKRKRMLDIFYAKKDVFQLKELEKIAPKEKGIIVQSVKDVVTSLVDDGFVDSEKIGTSVYFWAFPSKAQNIRKRKLEDIGEKIEDSKRRKITLEKEVERAKVGRGKDDEERAETIKNLQKAVAEKEKLQTLLKAYRDSDPDVIAKENEEIKIAVDAANRWTDNIFSTRTWIKNKFGFEEEAFNKQFNIPENFDYIDY